MSTQLYLAQGIAEGRAWSAQDPALQREVALARAAERRRRARTRTRRGRLPA